MIMLTSTTSNKIKAICGKESLFWQGKPQHLSKSWCERRLISKGDLVWTELSRDDWKLKWNTNILKWTITMKHVFLCNGNAARQLKSLRIFFKIRYLSPEGCWKTKFWGKKENYFFSSSERIRSSEIHTNISKCTQRLMLLGLFPSCFLLFLFKRKVAHVFFRIVG